MKFENIDVVGQHIPATLGALRRLHRSVVIVPIDECKHVQGSESVVESAAGHWFAGSNGDIKDFEAYSN